MFSSRPLTEINNEEKLQKKSAIAPKQSAPTPNHAHFQVTKIPAKIKTQMQIKEGVSELAEYYFYDYLVECWSPLCATHFMHNKQKH